VLLGLLPALVKSDAWTKDKFPSPEVTWSYLVAACLWLIHGVRKHDKSIYLACIGWIILDAAIVIGVIVRQ
jgi:hypothetical protein